MSTRRSSRQRPAATGGSGVSRLTDDQILDLISKLQLVVPEMHRSRGTKRVSTAKVLQETCEYIRSLKREVDDLSGRLSSIMESTDGDQAAVIRSLLM